jgi:hypothetical protein
MRKLLILVLVLFVFACQPADTFGDVAAVLRGLGDETYLDKEFVEDDIVEMRADGYFVLSDKESIAYMGGVDEIVLILDIGYKKKFLMDEIIITYVNIMYHDEKEKRFVDVVFEGKEHETGMSLNEFVKMLSEVKIDDAEEFLWKAGYIENKGT